MYKLLLFLDATPSISQFKMGVNDTLVATALYTTETRFRDQSGMDDVASSGAPFNPVPNAQVDRGLLALSIKRLFIVTDRS
jgi:hypothetical protein